MEKETPCVICGACCSYFRVEFDINKNKQVPVQFYTQKDLLWKIKNLEHKNIAAMNGAEKFKEAHCHALDGEIGKKALCKIYLNRPNPCMEFSVWESNGKQNKRCMEARFAKGLKAEITEEELLLAKKFKIENNIE